MTPERWTQIKRIVAHALELPQPERYAYVEQACAGDPELRAEVDSLLHAADGSDSFPAARVAIASAAEQSMLETTLGAQYEIIRPLGRGGMGAVYLARERALERFVAIKVLRPELANAAEGRERFRREARIAAQLSHPGILPLHTFGEVGGLWYFVMGYVRGVSLAERLRVEGRLPSGEAHRILTELADALECAHRSGVVHRDIKPANILLDDESGRAMLADFGISKVEDAGDSLTATGVVVGTPHYMSPEQALGSPGVNERSDIYSLGAVGYMMLAGREPFAGVRPADLMYWRVSHDPTPLQIVAPASPKDLAAVVMRCLGRDPASRWPNARSLRDALARISGDAAAALPPALRDLPTFGPYAVLWALAWTVLAIRVLDAPRDRALLLLVAISVPIGFGLHILNAGRQGWSTLELARIASWPPEWWGMWWPRVFRRPSDLWPRLPWPARAVRVALSLFLVALPGMILLRQRYGDDAVRLGGQPEWFVAAEIALLLGVGVSLAGAFSWAMRKRLGWDDSVRVLLGATMPSPSWSEPAVARLLATATGGVRPPDRDTPADHRRAIEELVRLLPADVTHTDAVATARGLTAAIEASDAEIASLSKVASTSELDRLTAQLSSLGQHSPRSGREGDELIALVERQLDVVRRMRDRCELASQQRARLFNMLRGVWTHLVLVHDAGADAAAATSARERVRELLVGAEAELGDRKDRQVVQ